MELATEKPNTEDSPEADSHQEEYVTVPTVTVRRESTPEDVYNTPFRYAISVGTAQREQHSEDWRASSQTLPTPQNGEPMIFRSQEVSPVKGFVSLGTQRISAYNVEHNGDPRRLFSYMRDKDGKMSRLYVYLDDNREVQVGPPQSEGDGAGGGA